MLVSLKAVKWWAKVILLMRKHIWVCVCECCTLVYVCLGAQLIRSQTDTQICCFCIFISAFCFMMITFCSQYKAPTPVGQSSRGLDFVFVLDSVRRWLVMRVCGDLNVPPPGQTICGAFPSPGQSICGAFPPQDRVFVGCWHPAFVYWCFCYR